MATRPAFFSATEPPLVRAEPVDFQWHAGMAKVRKQMCIRSLHEAIRQDRPEARVLEVSSASETELGVSLSAFNLTFTSRSGAEIAVECAFQGAKVFEQGGPYTDLLTGSPLDAKRDPRLKSSGRLTGFRWRDRDWPLEPLTAFYDWIYLNALHRRPSLAEAALAYDTFTDIAFNPAKSINCQAGAVALYVALRRSGQLETALTSAEGYLALIVEASGAARGGEEQGQLL
ncbi:DarT1-associated NADAR antitoxin family protein [Pseudoroseicyclus tamaricis]|uniref:Uncharacterized protein n=1 Tax=Pseudoroseicyclus tamaricis TaxID=2705421 RepID=A0A6B2JX16_9RHOB|nr:hypothetical protein [Pseudoroseicyclus tamaricis]NDV01209.1 hypothetical protein [Pseudoroseicyclus tamaricis]